MNQKEESHFEKALEVLENYISVKKLRKTPERNYILNLIYRLSNHFDVEELYQNIDSEEFHISKATVYNSLELFIDCGIVTRHYLNNNISVYERSYGFKQHDHFVCNQCKSITEFCDPRLYQIKKSLEEVLNVQISSHHLYLYGVCSNPDCQEKN